MNANQNIQFRPPRRKWDLKEVVNAVLYVTKNGCVWREVPGEFPPWQTVYYYYAKWVKEGVGQV